MKNIPTNNIENEKLEIINWIISCTKNFSETVAFFRDVMQLPISSEGVPVVDIQFSRYAQIKMPGNVVMEIVEPKDENIANLYTGPVVSITVDDLRQSIQNLEVKQIELITQIFDGKQGWGWTYFRAPDGNIYQIQGSYNANLE